MRLKQKIYENVDLNVKILFAKIANTIRFLSIISTA